MSSITSIPSDLSSYLASLFSTNQVAQTSQVSGSAANSDQSVESIGQGNSYGPAFILDITFSASSGSGSANTNGISNISLTYSPGDAGGSNGMQGAGDNPFAQFLSGKDGSTGATSTSSGAGSASETFGSTRFDQFLSQLAGLSSASGASISSGSGSSSLTATQQQAVQSILTQYQNAPATPATFQAVNNALQQAGINIAPPGGPPGGPQGGGINLASISGASSGSGSSLLSGSSSSGSSSTNSALSTASTSSSSGSGSSTDQALLELIQQLLASISSYLQNAGTTSTASTDSSTSAVSSVTTASCASGSSTASTFASTPLDQFLSQLVSTSSGSGSSTSSGSGSSQLTATQQQDVKNILTEYQNAPADQATFKAVHDALQQAGIAIAPPFGHHHGGGTESTASTSSASGSSASGTSAASLLTEIVNDVQSIESLFGYGTTSTSAA